MPGFDIFNDDAFSVQTLTASVNEREFVPSRVRSMGLFTPRGVSTTSVSIEKKGTALKLIQTSERGSAPKQRDADKRTLRNLNVQRIAEEATVYADEVQNVRAFGTESEVELVQNVVNQKLDPVLAEIDMTEENIMLGALRGIILDADGSTIYNLFNEFDVQAPAAFSFALGDSSTNVRQKCMEYVRLMARALKVGNMPFKPHVLCDDNFFDDLTSHASTLEAWERWNDGQALREGLAFATFEHGGVVFENYRGSDNDEVKIADGTGNGFATGIPNLFDLVYGPADTLDTVNTLGLPRYVIPGIDPSGKNRYANFEGQANLIAYCTRPQHLIPVTA